jgi:hypothetical protein
MESRIRGFRALSILIASLGFLASNGAAEPSDLEPSRADRLAAAIYFEGVPFEEARDLSVGTFGEADDGLDVPSSPVDQAALDAIVVGSAKRRVGTASLERGRRLNGTWA